MNNMGLGEDALKTQREWREVWKHQLVSSLVGPLHRHRAARWPSSPTYTEDRKFVFWKNSIREILDYGIQPGAKQKEKNEVKIYMPNSNMDSSLSLPAHPDSHDN